MVLTLKRIFLYANVCRRQKFESHRTSTIRFRQVFIWKFQTNNYLIFSHNIIMFPCMPFDLYKPFIKFNRSVITSGSCFLALHEQSCKSFVLFIYIFLKSCMTVSIWLYNEFSSRNLLRREGNDVMVQMLILSFIFYNKCPLPWICDVFHRQKTFCTKVFLFFIPSWFLILYLLTFLPFCLIP